MGASADSAAVEAAAPPFLESARILRRMPLRFPSHRWSGMAQPRLRLRLQRPVERAVAEAAAVAVAVEVEVEVDLLQAGAGAVSLPLRLAQKIGRASSSSSRRMP